MADGRDWRAIEEAHEFQELQAQRRRVVVPLGVVFVGWYGLFLVLTGYARDFMGESIYRGFTIGYAFAISLIPMTWAIAWIYIRAANEKLQPLADRAAESDERR